MEATLFINALRASVRRILAKKETSVVCQHDGIVLLCVRSESKGTDDQVSQIPIRKLTLLARSQSEPIALATGQTRNNIPPHIPTNTARRYRVRFKTFIPVRGQPFRNGVRNPGTPRYPGIFG